MPNAKWQVRQELGWGDAQTAGHDEYDQPLEDAEVCRRWPLGMVKWLQGSLTTALN
jgi:hypothetical protein